MVPRAIKVLLVIGAIVVVPVLLVVVTGTAKLYRIPSGSMLPTIEEGSRLVVLQRFADPAVGEVWTVRPPVGAGLGLCGEQEPPAGRLCDVPGEPGDSQLFVKRVVAGPGDTVELRDGQLLRNGRPADRFRCRNEGADCDFEGSITIPDGHWYLLGDNRGASDDSRYWGPVPTSSLVGKALFVD